MQPQPPRTPFGLIFGLVAGAGLIGAFCGGLGTYAVMTAVRTASGTANVPASPGFGNPKTKKLADGWWEYTFPDLDLSIELPNNVSPANRDFSARASRQVSQTANYEGGSAHAGLRFGAYWEKAPSTSDPEAVMKYNLSRPEYAKMNVKYTLEAATIDGNPACTMRGTYTEEGQASEVRMAYITRGNGLYFFETWFWASEEAWADGEWTRMLNSLHFLNRTPILR
ncbi:MAG: hypothetical protein ACHQ50_03000 [Fimbriimonadales bacterium]